MNIKKQTPTLRSYGVASIFNRCGFWKVKTPESGTPYWVYINSSGNEVEPANKIDATGNFAPGNSATLYSARDWENTQRNMELINSRLNSIHKELAYWDLYKITSTIDDPQQFASAVSALAVGESAVINSTTFTYAGIPYHRGDVITKINDTSEVLIRALNTGVYKPGNFEPVSVGSNNYTIKYTFVEADNPDAEVPGNITLNAETRIYGLVRTLTASSLSTSFAQVSDGTEPIRPVIKFFNTDHEQIEIDYLLTSGSNQWTISIIQQDSASYFNENRTTLYVQVK